MLKVLKKRIQRLLNGSYPLSFIVYKCFLHGNIVSNRFPIGIYNLLSNEKGVLGDAEEIHIDTYDGLGQATHPSIVRFKNLYYLACTPFPYGNDYYENPCIYKGINGVQFKQMPELCPIVLPRSHDRLVYLSDPFLYVDKEKLHLLYRECRYIDKNKYKAIIYEMTSRDGTTWSKPVKVFTSDQGAMCPCVIYQEENLFLYCVVFENEETSLVRAKMEKRMEFNRVLVRNNPDNMMLWHFDFFTGNEGKRFGLFTYSTDHYGSDSRLYLASQEDDMSWLVHNEIVIDSNAVTKMYKSCVLELENGTRNLYVSLKRKDRKWKIYVVKDFNYIYYL